MNLDLLKNVGSKITVTEVERVIGFLLQRIGIAIQRENTLVQSPPIKTSKKFFTFKFFL